MRLSRSLVRSALAAVVAFATPITLAACGGGGGVGKNNTSLVKITTPSLANGVTGVAYSQVLAANFPHTPGIFVVTAGSLPVGLSLDKQTGILSGYPRQVGAFQFEIAARDGIDNSIPQQRDASFAEDRRTYSVVISLGAPNILPQILPSAQYRSSYAYQIDVAGGTEPYTFTRIPDPSWDTVTGPPIFPDVTPAGTPDPLPAGITVSQTGLVGSFPTQAKQHPYKFTVKVTDALNVTATAHLSLDVVVLPLIILTSSPIQAGAISVPPGTGFAYDVPLDLASSGGGQPITWSQRTPIAGEIALSTIGMEIANVGGQGRFRLALPNQGPLAAGTFLFTAQVTDEAGQIASRQYSFTVTPGPVLTSISPNKQVNGAPITLTGSGFQPGAVVIFKPGASQVQVTPSAQTPTSLTLAAVPGSPGGGFVTVRVKNPDGGFYDLPSAYAFPANNISFSSSPIFPSPNSTLSSRGLDVADINNDGFADFVHCGSNTTWRNATGNASGVDLMLNAPPGGVFNSGTPTFTRVTLDVGNDWHEVRLADVNSDNLLDVVAVGNVGGTRIVRVWLQPTPVFPALGATSTQWQSVVPQSSTLNSQQGLATSSYGLPPHVQGLAVGRITNDTLPDIAYTQQDYGAFTSTTGVNYGGGRVSTMKGNGTGTFTGIQVSGQSIVASAAAVGVGIVPAASGGRGNVVVSDAAGGFQSYWNGGGVGGEIAHWEATNSSDLFGSWTAMVKAGTYMTECLCVATGDTNGDGIIDVLIPSGAVYAGATQALFSFVNNGSSYTAVQATAGSTGNERYVKIFDIDFDNILDCAMTVATNKVDFFKGRSGTQGFQFKTTVTVSTNSPNVSFIGAGDFDKDGRIDVAVCTSHLADNVEATHSPGYMAAPTADRGIGGQQGVFILLNTSN